MVTKASKKFIFFLREYRHFIGARRLVSNAIVTMSKMMQLVFYFLWIYPTPTPKKCLRFSFEAPSCVPEFALLRVYVSKSLADQTNRQVVTFGSRVGELIILPRVFNTLERDCRITGAIQKQYTIYGSCSNRLIYVTSHRAVRNNVRINMFAEILTISARTVN